MGNRYKNYPLFAFGGTILLLMVGSGIGVALLWFLGCTCMYCIAYSVTEDNAKSELERMQKELEDKRNEYRELRDNISKQMKKEKGDWYHVWSYEYMQYPEVKKLHDEIEELSIKVKRMQNELK